MADPTAFLSDFLPRPTSNINKLPSISPKAICRDGLAVLLFVARSDGDELPTSEIDTIRKYIDIALNRAGHQPTAQIVADLLRFTDTFYPTARSIGRYLERLERDDGALEILVPCLTELVRADGVYSENEQQAVSTLLKAIGKVRERRSQDLDTLALPKPSDANSKPTVPGNFIALDLETANSDITSICSIGLVHFSDGQVVKQLKTSNTDVDPSMRHLNKCCPSPMKSRRCTRDRISCQTDKNTELLYQFEGVTLKMRKASSSR